MSRKYIKGQFSSISHVQLIVTPWIATHQTSLSITNSQSLLRLMFIESVMPSSHLILCRLVFSLKVMSTVNQSHDYTHSTACVHAQLCQPCPALSDPLDCSPPGPSVHGTSQARILEWMVISFSRGSSRPRDRTPISCIVGRFLYHWAI